MNRSNCFNVLTLFLNHQSQEPLPPEGKVLHQTPIEVHTAADPAIAAVEENRRVRSTFYRKWEM
jgi:hypothetical protein